MKKVKLIVPVVLLTASVACLAAACGGGQTSDHKHSYSTAWTYDETYHWHASNCEHSEKTEGKATHTLTVTEVAPSCTEGGYTLHQCACGYSYKTDEYGQALGHIIVHYDGRSIFSSSRA